MSGQYIDRAKIKNMVMSQYKSEPCRICGLPISDDASAVFAGYSADNKARSAHGKCWLQRNDDPSSWVYP